MRRDCPSKRVMIVRDNGAYSSASDFDDETYAMLAANHAGSEDEIEETLELTRPNVMRASLCAAC